MSCDDSFLVSDDYDLCDSFEGSDIWLIRGFLFSPFLIPPIQFGFELSWARDFDSGFRIQQGVSTCLDSGKLFSRGTSCQILSRNSLFSALVYDTYNSLSVIPFGITNTVSNSMPLTSPTEKTS